ncbi:MAG TPA: protein kinase [Pyrinomonadaceae bacterium]|nr:protein kinase [Pyrinomonadaceae bacterium]
MTPELWEKITEVYNAALDLNGRERIEYIERECVGDAVLRREVESLLSADEAAGDFISTPAIGSVESWSGQFVAHYQIISQIGSGGMGEVYLAKDTKLNRLVALKTLPRLMSDHPDHLRRFENEARLAAAMNHPNVAVVYSVEDAGRHKFITMEYVEGKTLDEFIGADGIELKTFFEWFIPITDALAHAHEKGIIHRDIKPGNVMVTTGRVPKVLDFGLAQTEAISASEEQPSITRTDQVIGTPSYMSPEQAKGKEVDHRSDIFSLGVLMYEALTGQRPFRGVNQVATVHAVLYDKPEPIARLRPDVPTVVAKMVTRCLEKSPQRRFRSVKEVHSILKETRAASEAGISTDSFVRRFYIEATSRSKLWLAAAALAVLMLAMGGWYFISRPAAAPPFSVDTISIRKLSQSNDVALSVIAPDGRSVAYVTYEKDGSRSLWLRRVSDANAIRVVPSQPVHYWDIAFSNDNEYIYFITAPRFGTHGTLFRVSSLGGQPRKVAEKVNHLGNLSPDGKRILFVRYGDPAPDTSVNVTDSKLISADAENGSDEQVLKVLLGESIIRKARFSSDGRRIFYIKRELDGAEYWSIVMFDPRAGTEQTIIRKKERIEAIAGFQGDAGLLINAVNNVSNRRQLFYISIPSGDMTRITNDLNSYIGVSVDREGRNIVSVQRTDEARVWVGATSDLKSMTPLTREPLAHQLVDWTPDGRIVFDVLENDRLSVWVADVDGRNALQLTPADSDNSNPHVSGDGRYIVFTSKRGGFNQIWRMDIDGSNQVLLADAPGITQTSQFAADGKTVVFRWYNEGSPPMGQVPVEGGPVTGLDYLPNAFTYYWAMSPDGRYVAFTEGGDTASPMKVIVKPVDASAPKAVLNIRPTWLFKWMPDSKSIFYQESQQGEGLSTKVFQIEPAKGEPKLLMTTEPDDILDLTFSRDDKRFAAVRVRILTDAIMLTAAQPTQANR